MVDVKPTLEGVIGFAEALLAEGETAFHSGVEKNGGPRIKALAPGVGSGGVAGGANGVVNGRGDGPGAAKKEWTRKRETTDDGKARHPLRGFAATSSPRMAAGVGLPATSSTTWRGKRDGAGIVDLPST